ncbi:MAG: hypothetical protein Q4C91_19310 [Eubacteriales bacterium]|nr:hypothetical protein [Eubacteriales bacterium]
MPYLPESVGIKDGAEAGKTAVKWFVREIMELDAELAVVEGQLNQKYQEIPYAGNILKISGIGENTVSVILNSFVVMTKDMAFEEVVDFAAENNLECLEVAC